MKVALFSDIHGNLAALDVVLKDIDDLGGVDACWVLGDLVALGPEPIAVLERLTRLPNVLFVRGNTDRYVVTGDRPPPTVAQTKADLDWLPILLEVAQTFAWTQGAVTAAGWLDWLSDLPFEIRQTLPDGTRFLGVHAAPTGDDIPIYPNLSEPELESLLHGCQADLICMGHTHLPMNVRTGGRHIVNLGSVSNPIAPDLRASYVLLTAGSSGYQIEHRRVDYDHQAVIETLERIRHPGAAFIIRHLRGEYKG